MGTALTIHRPQERAHEKSALLQLALQRIAQQNASLDFDNAATGLIARIFAERGFTQRSERHTAIAQAIIIVRINLGLDRATGGDVEKAVRALSQNPIEKIYLLGEKTVADLRERAVTVWKSAVVSVRTRFDRSARYYGVTDEETERLLEKWATKGLEDENGLPPSTMEAIDKIAETLKRVETETRLAKNVNWATILQGSGEYGFTTFAATAFKRGARNARNICGGVWPVFLISVLANILTADDETEKRDIGIRCFVYLTPSRLEKFISLVLYEPESIAERRIRISVGFSKIAFRSDSVSQDVFHTALDGTAVQDELLPMLARALQRFAGQVREVFFGANSGKAEQAQDTGFDAVWSTRFFLTSQANTNHRLHVLDVAKHKPWERADAIQNIEQLSQWLMAFRHWPEDKQVLVFQSGVLQRVLTVSPFRRNASGTIIRETMDRSGEHFMQMLGSLRSGGTDFLPMFREMRAKEMHPDWITVGSILLKDDIAWFVLLASKPKWTLQALRDFFDRGHQYHEELTFVILQTVAEKLDTGSWREIAAACKTRGGVSACWKAMPEVMKTQVLFSFRSHLIGELIGETSTSNQVMAIVGEALEWWIRHKEPARELEIWFNGIHKSSGLGGFRNGFKETISDRLGRILEHALAQAKKGG
jgi:hypothetical protein